MPDTIAQPTLILAVGGVLLVVALIAAVAALVARRRERSVVARGSAEAPAERRALAARLLLLKLDGDADGALGRAIAGVAARRLESGTTIVDGGGAGARGGGRAGRAADEEARKARAQAQKARVGAVAWGAAVGDILCLRIISEGGAGPAEAFSFPADLRSPFDAALAAVLAASAGQRAALASAAAEIAEALKKPPADALDATRLRAAAARAVLALEGGDRDSLDVALAATAAPDPRRETEPLEWAEVRALRAEALGRSLEGVIEPPMSVLRERVDALRGATEAWSEAGAADRVARAEAGLAQALLDLAERESDVRGLAEAVQLSESALARAKGGETAALAALLGGALVRLGEREPRAARLEAAERELRRALVLAEAAGDRVRAAAVKDDLARALARLGERDRGAERLRAAAVIYRLSVEDPHRNDLARARMRAALGRTLVHVGERERDAGAVDEAVGALRMAANSFTACGAAAEAALARRALERAERLYSELRAAARSTVDAEG